MDHQQLRLEKYCDHYFSTPPLGVKDWYDLYDFFASTISEYVIAKVSSNFFSYQFFITNKKERMYKVSRFETICTLFLFT